MAPVKIDFGHFFQKMFFPHVFDFLTFWILMVINGSIFYCFFYFPIFIFSFFPFAIFSETTNKK